MTIEKEISPSTPESRLNKELTLLATGVGGSLGRFLEPVNVDEVIRGLDEGKFVPFEYKKTSYRRAEELETLIKKLGIWQQSLDRGDPVQAVWADYVDVLTASRKMRVTAIRRFLGEYMALAKEFYGQPDGELVRRAREDLGLFRGRLIASGQGRVSASGVQKEIEEIYQNLGMGIETRLIEGQQASVRVVPRPDGKFRVEIAVDEEGLSKIETGEDLLRYLLKRQTVSAIRRANGEKQPLEFLASGRPMPEYLADEMGLQLYVARELGLPGWREREKIPEAVLMPEINLVALDLAASYDTLGVYQQLRDYGLSKEAAVKAAMKAKKGTTGRVGEYDPRTGLTMVGLSNVENWVKKVVGDGSFSFGRRDIPVKNAHEAVGLLMCCKCSTKDLERGGRLANLAEMGMKVGTEDLTRFPF